MLVEWEKLLQTSVRHLHFFSKLVCCPKDCTLVRFIAGCCKVGVADPVSLSLHVSGVACVRQACKWFPSPKADRLSCCCATPFW